MKIMMLALIRLLEVLQMRYKSMKVKTKYVKIGKGLYPVLEIDQESFDKMTEALFKINERGEGKRRYFEPDKEKT